MVDLLKANHTCQICGRKVAYGKSCDDHHQKEKEITKIISYKDRQTENKPIYFYPL